MGLLSTLTIKLRLILLSAAAIFLIAAVGLLGLDGLRNAEHSIENLYKKGIGNTARLAEIFDHFNIARSHLFLSLQHDPGSQFTNMHNHKIDMHINKIHSEMLLVNQKLRELQSSDLEQHERATIEELINAKNIVETNGFTPAITALNNGDFTKANEILLTIVNPTFEKADIAAEKLLELQKEDAKYAFEKAETTYNNILTWTIGLLVLGITICGVLAIITIRGISQAVTRLDDAATQLAAGNLAARVDYNGQDEITHIADSFNAVATKFKETVIEITEATDQLAAAAEETSVVTIQTTKGIQRQRTETEMVATAVNQMNASAHEVAENASHASTAAKLADDSSYRGKEVVNETVDDINKLADEVDKAADVIENVEHESENIGTVLDVIRGIAKQTNLLALNASIEAARAGEHGSGFAVVANEVRTLASRTQKSTEEIQEMISRLQSGSKNAVEVMNSGEEMAHAGVKQAEEAGAALTDITTAVDEINQMNTQIATAVEQQSAVTEEISRNLTNIKEIAEQTAVGATQTAAASKDLAHLAEHLKVITTQFKV
ncbi:MAG: methyl-accepting chemotaxis protein [Chromatiales bacterium]|nr:methyl-accepting chemotaxis protein [Chromatiales bacterium]